MNDCRNAQLSGKGSTYIPLGLNDACWCADPERLDYLLTVLHFTDPVRKDDWRLDILRSMCAHFFFTSTLCTVLLKTFKWTQVCQHVHTTWLYHVHFCTIGYSALGSVTWWSHQERIQACIQLFARVVDPQNLDDMLEVLGKRHRTEVYAALGVLSRFTPNNPTGSYSLVLSRQLDYMIARRLQLAYQQEFAEGLVNVGGVATTCFRNIAISGSPTEVMDPYQWKLPEEVSIDGHSAFTAIHISGACAWRMSPR